MKHSMLWSAWGLALAVLFGSTMAQAQPPDLPPPPGAVSPAPLVPGTPGQPAKLVGPLTLPTYRITEYPTIGDPGKPLPPPVLPHNPGAAPYGAVPMKMPALAAHGNHEEDHNALIFIGEYLLLRPRRREQDFAIVGTNPMWGPIGTIKNIDGGFDSGFRVGAGYHWCGGCEAVFLYTHYGTEAEDTVRRGGGQTVFPTLTHPAIANEVAAAEGENSINLNLYDLELGRRWKQGESLTLRGFIGPRIADLDQEFEATYTGGDVTTDVVRRNLTFEGAGLRAGGEVNYQFWEFLGAYARGSASMLVGQFRSSLTEVVNGRTIVNVSEKYDKVVPIVELGVGVSFQKGGWRITAGYEFINWFGAVEGIDFTDDAHPAKLNRRWGDLGFDGFVFRAEYLF